MLLLIYEKAKFGASMPYMRMVTITWNQQHSCVAEPAATDLRRTAARGMAATLSDYTIQKEFTLRFVLRRKKSDDWRWTPFIINPMVTQ